MLSAQHRVGLDLESVEISTRTSMHQAGTAILAGLLSMHDNPPTGKIEGQPAHTREVKIGCVFTQTTLDRDGRPVRDEESTSYVAAIETAEQFGLRLYTEAWRRGWSRAQKTVVIGDGAVWIWNLAEQSSISQAPLPLSISTTPASISINFPPSCFPPTAGHVNNGRPAVSIAWNAAKSNRWFRFCATLSQPPRSWQNSSPTKRPTFNATRTGCVILPSALRACLLALVLSKLDAKQ